MLPLRLPVCRASGPGTNLDTEGTNLGTEVQGTSDNLMLKCHDASMCVCTGGRARHLPPSIAYHLT
jgi:hypothetical protein